MYKRQIYSYAKEGFGEFVGFNSAWGYWMSALISNVSYITLLFGALGYFFPVFQHGNNTVSILCGSLLVWLLVFLVLKGVGQATFITIIATVCKLVPIFVFIAAIPLAVSYTHLDVYKRQLSVSVMSFRASVLPF